VADLQIGQSVTVLPYFNCGRCHACRIGRPNACTNNQTMGVQREGAMTQRVLIPASKVIAVEGIALRSLALVEPCSVGFHAVRRSELAATETVFIMGCGMIWSGSTVGARRRGATIIAFDLSDDKLAVARSLGAHATINAGDPNWRAKLSAIAPVADRVISRIVPLAEAPAALAEWNRDPGGYTKILVEI
jgi:threonine dehydrogenase-like Zn-dependent dehydrogenase